MGEVELAAILCAMLGGEVEKRHHFAVLDRVHYVSVDCETPTHVIEVGLDDRRSSYDSVHQAGFAAALTGKTPKVILLDTNGIEENAEFQVETASRRALVEFEVVPVDLLLRWRMSAWFRERGAPAPLGPAVSR
jgi:hypothetical protein